MRLVRWEHFFLLLPHFKFIQLFVDTRLHRRIVGRVDRTQRRKPCSNAFQFQLDYVYLHGKRITPPGVRVALIA